MQYPPRPNQLGRGAFPTRPVERLDRFFTGALERHPYRGTNPEKPLWQRPERLFGLLGAFFMKNAG